MNSLDSLISDIESLRKSNDDTVLVLALGVKELKIVSYGDMKAQVNDIANLMMKDENLLNLVRDVVVETDSFETDLNKLI